MKLCVTIPLLLSLLVAVSCRESSLHIGDDVVIASVEGRTLRSSELERIVPKGLSAEDSTAFVARYAQRWILNSVKLLEADRVFASSAQDIEDMVEEYRNSLMVRRLERDYVNKNYTIPELEEQIAQYYEEHSESFKLNAVMVKGRILTFPKEYKQAKELLKEMTQLADKKGGDFRSICEKRGFELAEFTTSWIEYSDFLSRLPIVRRAQNSEYISKLGKIQQLEDEDNRYYFQVSEVMNIGEREPLERVEDKIRYILNNKSQSEFLLLYEETLLNDALQRGVIRNYTIDERDE